jgi:hypothetical protein
MYRQAEHRAKQAERKGYRTRNLSLLVSDNQGPMATLSG